MAGRRLPQTLSDLEKRQLRQLVAESSVEEAALAVNMTVSGVTLVLNENKSYKQILEESKARKVIRDDVGRVKETKNHADL
jgi:hypothetical protein